MDQVHHKPCRLTSVNHAVIIGQPERQKKARLNSLTSDDRLQRSASQSQYRDLGFVDDRRKVGSPNSTLVGNGKRSSLEVLGTNFSIARLAGEVFQLF